MPFLGKLNCSKKDSCKTLSSEIFLSKTVLTLLDNVDPLPLCSEIISFNSELALESFVVNCFSYKRRVNIKKWFI